MIRPAGEPARDPGKREVDASLTTTEVVSSCTVHSTWSSKASRIAQGFCGGVLLIASFFYAAGARAHRTFMRRTTTGRGRPACAVMSVGGLTVGGAGKTPVAARLAVSLQRRGWRVVLASRGYKGRNREPVSVVSDGVHIHSNVAQAGDESFILAGHAPGVPVLVGRDRRIVGHHAVAGFDAQILILDDGFQHHRLARDLDIVCIDGVGGFGNCQLFPAGPLREPISTLRHADWLCVIDGRLAPASVDGTNTVEAEVLAAHRASGRKVISANRQPIELVSLDRSKRLAVSWLAGRRVGLFCGVARPTSVRRTLESLGAEIVAERRFRDHHTYHPRDCRGLDQSGLVWITTEKDALKILPAWIGATPLWVLRIEVEIDDEDDVLDRLEEGLRAKGRLGA